MVETEKWNGEATRAKAASLTSWSLGEDWQDATLAVERVDDGCEHHNDRISTVSQVDVAVMKRRDEARWSR